MTFFRFGGRMGMLAMLIFTLVGCLAIGNFFYTFDKRGKLISPAETSLGSVPCHFLTEVELQRKDGYKLVSVDEKSVKLIKKKRYWGSFLILLPMPNAINIILTSSFYSNIYGIELRLVGEVVELTTY
jgi:hypothetical protein